MRSIFCSLLAIALLSYLAEAQWSGKPAPPAEPSKPMPPYQPPQTPQIPQQPQRPQEPVRPQRPQQPYVPPPKEPQQPYVPPPKEPQQPYVPPPQQPQTPYVPPPQQPQTPYVPPPQQPQTPYVPPPKNPQTPYVPPPQQPQTPYVPPPKNPQTPYVPPPQQPQTPYVPPPKNPQTPYVPPPQQPQQPQTPYVPPPKNPQTPYVPPSKNPQTPYVPPPKNPQTPYVPPSKVPQQPQDPSKTPNPQTPTFHSCEVDSYAKIQCGSPSITASQCEAINCCYDGYMCYYGKSVTLQCTKDGQFIIVVARDATLPNIDLESIHFIGEGTACHPVGTTSAFAVYQFPVTECGTVMTEEPGVIIYENRMSSAYEVAVGPYGAITRDSQYELFVQCRYIGTTVEALVIEVDLVPPPPPVAAPGPLRVELRLGNGVCGVKGCVEADVAYTSYYQDSDYPVTKVLRDPVYVEVRLLDRTDPNLVLTLGRCWANTSPNPDLLPQWDLLINGCPNPDDRYLTSLVHLDASSGLMFPTHYRRFIFKMFTFVGQSASDYSKKVPADPGMHPLTEEVYIHCDVAVCQPSPTNSCEPRCYRKKREIASSTKKVYREEATVVSSKAVVITGEEL